MKRIDDKYKDIAEDTETVSEEESRKVHRMASVAVILIVLALVTVISTIVYFVEMRFGKAAGTVGMIILAIAIAGYLYRNEIKSKFKRK